MKRVSVVGSLAKKSYEVWTRETQAQVEEGYNKFWTRNKVSHFKDGIPIRTNVPRERPIKQKASDIGFQ